MNLDKQALDNAKAMLSRYNEKHGAVAKVTQHSVNYCWGCGFTCIGGCVNNCMLFCNGSCRNTCIGRCWGCF